MPDTESWWSFGLLGLLFLGVFVFRRMRRRTRDFHDSREVRQRLAPWARLLELLLFSALLAALMILILTEMSKVHPGRSEGAAAVFAAIGAGLVAVPISLLGVNTISWLIPSMRKANLDSMAGTQVSFASANRGLVFAAAVMIPVGAILIALAALQPWGR